MTTDNPESPYAAQINVKMSLELKQGLEALFERHSIAPAELLRRLAVMAISYEQEAGEFALNNLRLIKQDPLARAEIEKTKTAKPVSQARLSAKNIRDKGQFSRMTITPPGNDPHLDAIRLGKRGPKHKDIIAKRSAKEGETK